MTAGHSQGAKRSFIGEWFSFSGRVDRQSYIWRTLLLVVLNAIVFTAAQERGLLYVSLLALPLLLAYFSLMARRGHDVDRPAWFFIILFFIPTVNIFAALYLYFKKGTDGPNRFGPDPLG